MDIKKDWPKLIIAFICLVALMMYIEVKGSEILPTLLGFALGGFMIFVLVKKISKKK